MLHSWTYNWQGRIASPRGAALYPYQVMFGKTIKSLAAKVPEHRNSTYVAQAIAAAGIAAARDEVLLFPRRPSGCLNPFPLIAEAGGGLG